MSNTNHIEVMNRELDDVLKDERLIFLYEELMTKEMREAAGVRGSPLCLAMMRGSIWKTNEGKRKRERLVLSTHKNTHEAYIYGIIFKMDSWKCDALRLNAYFGSLQINSGRAGKNSFVKFEEKMAVPFTLDKLDDLRVCKFKSVGSPVKVITPLYNELNERTPKNIQWRRIDYPHVQEVLRELGWSEERIKVNKED